MKKFLSTLAIAGVATLALASCNGGGENPTTTTTEKPVETTTEKPVETTTTGPVETSTTDVAPVDDTFDPSKWDFTKIADKTITVWVSELEGVKELTDAQVKRYLEEIGVEGFEVSVKGVPEGEASSNVLQNVESAADIYCIAQDQLANLVQANACGVVWEDFTDAVKTRNDATSNKASTVGQELYAYPITSDNGYVMYYNKTALAGVDMNSLEDIIAKCEESKMNFCMDLNNAWYNAGFFFGTGCTSSWQTNEDGEFTAFIDTFNSDNGLKALKGMYKLLSSEYFHNSGEASEFKMDTKAAVVVTGPWNTNACQAALGDDYAVAKLPCFTVDDETFQIGSYSGCKLMCVKPQTDREKLVLCNAIANYLSGEECSLERFTEFKWGPSNKAAQASDEVQADLALAAIADQAQYATPQGNIFDGWWTIGGEIAINAKKTDGSDAALREVLVTYEEALADALDLYKKGPQALLVGKWNGWNNADADYIMTYDEDLGTWTFELTVDDSLDYKGGRIVEAASWTTIAGWDNVDEDSMVYLDENYDPEKLNDKGESVNGDKNLVFKQGGKYLITYDEATETITIEEAE